MTDAAASTLQGALNFARDNGASLCEPLHLAAVLFSKDDSIGTRVVVRSITYIDRTKEVIALYDDEAVHAELGEAGLSKSRASNALEEM
jgi:hypothetical protein